MKKLYSKFVEVGSFCLYYYKSQIFSHSINDSLIFLIRNYEYFYLHFSSITKKIWMALLGLFLMVFLVVHLGINLMSAS